MRHSFLEDLHLTKKVLYWENQVKYPCLNREQWNAFFLLFA